LAVLAGSSLLSGSPLPVAFRATDFTFLGKDFHLHADFFKFAPSSLHLQPAIASFQNTACARNKIPVSCTLAINAFVTFLRLYHFRVKQSLGNQ
jgi:hypothetical protein